MKNSSRAVAPYDTQTWLGMVLGGVILAAALALNLVAAYSLAALISPRGWC